MLLSLLKCMVPPLLRLECANDAAETGGGARQERERKMEKCPGALGPALHVRHEVLDNMVLFVECCSPEGILLG